MQLQERWQRHQRQSREAPTRSSSEECKYFAASILLRPINQLGYCNYKCRISSYLYKCLMNLANMSGCECDSQLPCSYRTSMAHRRDRRKMYRKRQNKRYYSQDNTQIGTRRQVKSSFLHHWYSRSLSLSNLHLPPKYSHKRRSFQLNKELRSYRSHLIFRRKWSPHTSRPHS